MERTWKDYVALHHTIEGARAAFEIDCQVLLKTMYPDETVKVVRANPGDDGIDIYIGNIGVSPIEVYQCKFFLGPLGNSQKGQIRDSFNTALASKEFEMYKWHLLMPIDDLDIQENVWWGKWKTKQEELSKVKIYLSNGNEIKYLFKKHKLYEIVFQIEQALEIKHIHAGIDKLLEIHGGKNEVDVKIDASATNGTQNLTDNPNFGTAFSYKYKPAYEKFYIQRISDNAFDKGLRSPRNVWIYGASGIGKTVLCARTISRSKCEFLYCYLNAAPDAKEADILLNLIYESLYSKYEESISEFKYSGVNIIKKIVALLIRVALKSNLILCIDEVPICNDKVFGDFANSIVAICTEYSNMNSGEGEIKFVISTIKNPKSFYQYKGKVSELFTFIELPDWTQYELNVLYNIIIDKVGHILSEKESVTLLANSKTPRVLKDALYNYIMQDKGQPFEKVLNDIIEQN